MRAVELPARICNPEQQAVAVSRLLSQVGGCPSLLGLCLHTALWDPVDSLPLLLSSRSSLLCTGLGCQSADTGLREVISRELPELSVERTAVSLVCARRSFSGARRGTPRFFVPSGRGKALAAWLGVLLDIEQGGDPFRRPSALDTEFTGTPVALVLEQLRAVAILSNRFCPRRRDAIDQARRRIHQMVSPPEISMWASHNKEGASCLEENLVYAPWRLSPPYC